MRGDDGTSGDPIPHARNIGTGSFMNLPRTTDATGADAVVVGIPYDLGGEAGARHAPNAIRSVSWMLRPTHGSFHIDVLQSCRAIDFGDVPTHPSSRETTFAAVEGTLGAILDAGAVPIVLSGDHSLLLAELRAVSRKHGPVALIQIDAHADTQDVYYGTERYTSGTVIRRAVEEGVIEPARSIQVALRGPVYSPEDHLHSDQLGLARLPMDEVDRRGIPATIEAIRARCGDAPVFVTFDMDSVDPAFAPGTGRPEPGGLSSREALTLLRGLRGLRLVGFDINEVNPLFDVGRTTCVLAAHVTYEFMTLVALGCLAERGPGAAGR